jgi:hypothetical protein
MFIDIGRPRSLAPGERHLSSADAAPPELGAIFTIRSINIALLRSEAARQFGRTPMGHNPVASSCQG